MTELNWEVEKVAVVFLRFIYSSSFIEHLPFIEALFIMLTIQQGPSTEKYTKFLPFWNLQSRGRQVINKKNV